MDRRIFLAGFAALAASAPAAEAAAWIRLGRKSVSALEDFNVIDVGGGRFRRLRFKMSGGAFELYNVKVVYADGGLDDLPVEWQVPPRGLARELGIGGGGIREIRFFCARPAGYDGKAAVTVWGRR
jgi:hypothetical protein